MEDPEAELDEVAVDDSVTDCDAVGVNPVVTVAVGVTLDVAVLEAVIELEADEEAVLETVGV